MNIYLEVFSIVTYMRHFTLNSFFLVPRQLLFKSASTYQIKHLCLIGLIFWILAPTFISANSTPSVGEQAFIYQKLLASCAPISTLNCNEIAVSLPYSLTFDGSEGGLIEKNGLETGFTMNLPASALLAEDNPTPDNDLPGFEPGRLSILNGHLTFEAAKGIAYRNPPGGEGDFSNGTNSQINTLGVGIDASSYQQITFQTTIANPYIDANVHYEQGGLWFGIDEDNFVKLVFINADGGAVELRVENNSNSSSQNQKMISNISGLGESILNLRLEVDIENSSVAGFFSLNGSAENKVGTLSIPEKFINGNSFTNHSLSYGGIYTSKRNEESQKEVLISFEDFSLSSEPISPIENKAPIIEAQSFDISEDASVSATVGTITATDPEQAPLTYAIQQTTSLPFTVDETEGTIMVNQLLDFEQQNTYEFTVAVSDGEKSSSADITVNILDVAENEPDTASDLLNVKINFQDPTSTVPIGYLRDSGEPFGIRDGVGQSDGTYRYGWVAASDFSFLDLTTNGRNRNRNGIPIISNTLMHMQYGDVDGNNGNPVEGAWEFAVKNGLYKVTVQVGDQSFNNVFDSQHTINVEGVNAINSFQGATNNEYEEASVVVDIKDCKITIDALGGFNTKINAVEIEAYEGGSAQPFFTGVSPADNATNIPIEDFQITVGIITPDGYELDKATIDGNIKLYEQTPSGLQEVPSNSNDTGGGDAITLTPSVGNLKPSTTYIFRITGVEANLIGNLNERLAFTFFESRFTTTSALPPSDPKNLEGVSFTQVEGNELGEGVNGDRFTSMAIGPDGRLYAATAGEEIKRWDINPDGTLSNLQILSPNLTGSSHPVSGTPTANARLIIGFEFAPEATANNLVAYVTHSALTLTDGPEWDGKLTRLSGPNLESVQDILIHLPRSIKDHLTNSIAFKGDDLYIVQGSNTAGGDPDPAWGFRPERLLAAAVLKLEFSKLPNNLPLSVYTTDDIGVINNAPANSIQMSDGTYNPYAINSPVTLFATGVRNAYDLVWHSNDFLYIPTNGTAGNNTNSPNTPASADYITPENNNQVRRPDGSFITDTSIPGIQGGETQKDWLFKATQGTYHGHPNPLRGEFVLNHGGITYSGLPGQSAPYTDVAKYPNDLGPDPDYVEPAYDFGKNISPNGALEYKSNSFNGKLKGMLMVARFSGQDDIMVMQVGNDGDVIKAFPNIPGLQGFDDPLEIVEDISNGNVYVAQYDRAGNKAQKLILLRVNDQPTAPVASIQITPAELIFETTVNNQGPQTDTKTITITNDGPGSLIFTDFSLNGPFEDQFSLSGPTTLPIPAGSAQTFEITFEPNLNQQNLGYQQAELIIQSNADNAGFTTVGLHGLKKKGFEGNAEPPLQDVVNTLGIGIDVGWTSLANTMAPIAQGEEVLISLFEKAGPGPITMEPVARYSPQEKLPYGWYTNDEAVTQNQVGELDGSLAEAQTLFPEIDNGGTTFDPQDEHFGFYVNSQEHGLRFTEDELNNAASNGSKHRVRIYPMKNRAGVPIDDSYLVCFEDANNGDYQDYVFIISNIQEYIPQGTEPVFNPGEWYVENVSGTNPEKRHESAFVEVDGKFYLIGGRGTKKVQVYDPSLKSWSNTNTSTQDIHHFQAVAYESKIYIIGAMTGGFPDEDPIPNILIYDPQEDQLSTAGNIPPNRLRGAAGVVVHDDQFYIVSGNRNGHKALTAEGDPAHVKWFDSYNPATGAWTILPDAPNARDHFHASVINNKLYIAGGRRSSHGSSGGTFGNTEGAVDVYDFNTQTWLTGTEVPDNLPTQRAGASSAVMGSDLLIIGGETNNNNDITLAKTESLNTLTGKWRTLSNMNLGRHGSQAIVYNNNIYIAAGSKSRGGDEITFSNQFMEILSFDGPPLSNVFPEWTNINNSFNARSEAQCIVYNKEVYFFHGFAPNIKIEKSCEKYNPATNTWTTLSPMPNQTNGKSWAVTHNGIALDGDVVWIVGGRIGDHPGKVTDKVWLYDISDDSWSEGPSLPFPAGGGGLGRLGRKLHYVGGFDSQAKCDVDVHLVYDLDSPSLGWQDITAIAPMPEPRNHFGTVVAEGKLYTIGGQHGHDAGCSFLSKTGTNVKDTHVYDPATNSWTKLNDFPHNESHVEPGTFTLDNHIYVVGGQNKGKEINQYNINSGNWSELTEHKLPVGLLAPGARIFNQNLIVMAGGAPNTTTPTSVTRIKDFPRTPVKKLGFNPEVLDLFVDNQNPLTVELILYASSGETQYSLSGNLPSWLSINKTQGKAYQSFEEIEATVDASNLTEGNYTYQLTASADGYTNATITINLSVVSTDELKLHTSPFLLGSFDNDQIQLGQIYPNAIDNTATLHVDLSQTFTGQVEYDLVDPFGKIIFNRHLHQTSPVSTLNLDIEVESIKAGLYFLRVHGDGLEQKIYSLLKN